MNLGSSGINVPLCVQIVLGLAIRIDRENDRLGANLERTNLVRLEDREKERNRECAPRSMKRGTALGVREA